MAVQAMQWSTLDHAPSDADFDYAYDGLGVVETDTPHIWVRDKGAWVQIV